MPGLISTALSHEEVYMKIYKEAQLGSYISYIRGKRCTTEVAFFREISASFQFPWYFGENWAAFDECICDLEWLKFQRIFILFDDFRKMFNGDVTLQKVLVKYLCGILEYWQTEGISIEIVLNN